MFLTAFQGGVLHYIWFHKKLPESSVAGILQGLSESGVMAFNWGSWVNFLRVALIKNTSLPGVRVIVAWPTPIKYRSLGFFPVVHAPGPRTWSPARIGSKRYPIAKKVKG